MKAARSYKYIPPVVLTAGLAGIVLRCLLYTFGPDDRGLISHSHPLHMACGAIALAVGIYLALSVRRREASENYRDNFPPNRQLLAAVIVVPLCFASSALTALSVSYDRIGTAWAVIGFAAVPGMAYALYCQMTGKRPFLLVHVLICLYFAMDMICRYRFWSGNPQLADYTFHLFACAFLSLNAYYRAALCAGMGSRRMLLFTGWMSVLFCMFSLVGPDSLFAGPDQLLRYLGGAVWAAGSMCTLTLPRHRKSHTGQEEP